MTDHFTKLVEKVLLPDFTVDYAHCEMLLRRHHTRIVRLVKRYRKDREASIPNKKWQNGMAWQQGYIACCIDLLAALQQMKGGKK